ncbi:putative RNA-directed DNA polymerase [Tanacetum coccineum]
MVRKNKWSANTHLPTDGEWQQVKRRHRGNGSRLNKEDRNTHSTTVKKGRPDTDFDRVMRKKATSFFFTNFSDSWDSKALWKMFDMYGIVVDVYVAFKKTKLDSRFGFVRFINIGDLDSFENRLKGIMIGDTRSIINRAKFIKVGGKGIPVDQVPDKRHFPAPIMVIKPNWFKGHSYRDAFFGGAIKPQAGTSSRRPSETVKIIELEEDCCVRDSSVGAFGGLLTMWDPGAFFMESHVVNANYLCAFGSLTGINHKVALLNIYTPQASSDKVLLWNSIENLINSMDAIWIIFGDFNVVRCKEERAGTIFKACEANAFNDFLSRIDSKSGLKIGLYLEALYLMRVFSNLKFLWMRLKRLYGGSKSPGPDGFNFNFIKAYWEVLKFDFFECIKHFETFGKLESGCNPSFIVLIPKKIDPLGFSDYRPISLIGCVYKVISKVLSLRLAKVIPTVISPNQTAFLAGRQILDGSLIANEIIHMAKIENHDLLLFKVDFKKAFDSVSSISVLINGSPSNEFKMERGLRQGDPLSPFLFHLVAEALQVSIIEACNKGLFKGVYLAEDGSNVSLLQYADDALFFGKWSRYLILILKCFEEASGLKVNLSKSIIFGVGVGLDEVEAMASSLNCSHDNLPFMYLGLPVGKSMNFCDGWSEVVNRIQNRLLAWKAKSLSIGGRLIKSVLGSIPIYFLSLFKAPLKVINTLESLRRRFFWGFKEDQRVGAFSSSLGSISGQGVWWDIIKADRTIDSVDVAYKNSFSLKVSNGLSTSFWKDAWCHGRSRLMDLYHSSSRFTRFKIAKSTIDGFLWMEAGKVWAWWGLAPPVSFPSFSISDISSGNLGFPNNPLLSKVLIGVFQCALWGVWKWRNKVVNASDEDLNDAKNEDIFPSIQRLSKLWISARCKRMSLK